MALEGKYNFNFNFPSTLANTAATEIELSDATFVRLRDFIYERCGIYLSDKGKYMLASRLSKRLKTLNLTNFESYLRLLADPGGSSRELEELFNAVTINETSFFRNLPQINAFQDVVLPERIEQINFRNARPIRILSAGCASGEEPYTLAMTIRKNFPELVERSLIEIHGIDISENSINTALEGSYSDFSLRNLPGEYRSAYFAEFNGKFLLSDDIKKMVQFQTGNLMDITGLKALGMFDIIFCRNVFIYFDKESKSRTIQALYEMLNPGGYLFIGHSESLHGISRAFKLAHFVKAIAYKK